MFHALIAVAVILTVIRHTRAEEESGRTELLDSTAVGRYASLTAALILTFGASIATGLIGTAGLLDHRRAARRARWRSASRWPAPASSSPPSPRSRRS